MNYYNISPNVSGAVTLEDLRLSRNATAGLGKVSPVQFIDEMSKIIDQSGLEYNIHEMFYKNNGGRNPGVEMLDITKETEERQLEYASVEKNKITLHHPSLLLFKRLIGVFKMKGFQDDEQFGNIAFSINQNGFEIASGLTVKVCSNMSILSADQRITTFGKDKTSIDGMIDKLKDWTSNYKSNYTENVNAMNQLRNTNLDTQQVNEIFGDLYRMNTLNNNTKLKPHLGAHFAAIGQSTISKGQSTYLNETLLKQRENTTAWDLVNDITLGMKAENVDTVTMFKDNSELFQFMLNAIN